MKAVSNEQLDAFEQRFRVTLPISLRRYYTQDQQDYHFTSFSMLEDEFETDRMLPLTGPGLNMEKLALWDREDELIPRNSLIPIAEGGYDYFYYLDTINENIYLHRRGEEEWVYVMNNFAEFIYQIEINQ